MDPSHESNQSTQPAGTQKQPAGTESQLEAKNRPDAGAGSDAAPRNEPETIKINMPPVSAVILALENKDLITQTMRSVEAFSAEILVVDVVSADSPAADTPWGCKTIRLPWEGDLADLKNRAAAKATGEWILWLAPGELFAGGFTEEFITFMALEADSNEQYYMMVEQSAAGGAAEQIADIRVTPRRDGLVFDGRVRENTLASADELGVRTSGAPGRIVQTEAIRTNEMQRRAAERNLTLAEIALQESADAQPRFLLAKAEALSALERFEESADAYRAALAASEPGSPEMLEAHYGIVTLHGLQPSDPQAPITSATAALEAFPCDAQLLCAMGNLMQQRGRLDLAIRAFEAAVTHGVVEPRTWHSPEVFDVAAICLSVCHQKQGDEAAAHRVLKEALQSRPEANRVRRRLIEREIAAGREEEAVRLLDDMVCTHDARETLESVVRGACKAVSGNYVAAYEQLQPVYVAGCVDPWCFRWFILTLIGGGKPDAAAKVAARWREIDPNSTEAKAYEAQVAKVVEEKNHSSEGSDVRIDPGPDEAPTGYAGNPSAENVRR